MSKIIITISILLLFLGCKSKTDLPSFAETYDRTDEKPFGTKVLYQALESFFFQNNISVKRTHFKQIEKEFSDTGVVYISVTPHFLLTENERNALLRFVYRGNTVFLSSSEIDDSLLHRLGLNQFVNEFNTWRGVNADATLTGMTLINYPDLNETTYQYRYLPMTAFFKGVVENQHRVLGVNAKNNLIFYWLFMEKEGFMCIPNRVHLAIIFY